MFNVYGITVDPRHLLLIADYMTYDGTFKPLSRRGMESAASPLQKMSFESSLYFLQRAAVSSEFIRLYGWLAMNNNFLISLVALGQCENLESPSSRLMIGQPCKSGTGAVTLMNAYSSDYLLRYLTS